MMFEWTFYIDGMNRTLNDCETKRQEELWWLAFDDAEAEARDNLFDNDTEEST